MSGRSEAGGRFDDVLHWLDGLAAQLLEASAGTRRVKERLEQSWMDDRGQGWTERAGLVQRQLERDAEACAELAARIMRAVREQDAVDTSGADVVAPPDFGGPRLAGTTVRRADAVHGVRLATLADVHSASDGDS